MQRASLAIAVLAAIGAVIWFVLSPDEPAPETPRSLDSPRQGDSPSSPPLPAGHATPPAPKRVETSEPPQPPSKDDPKVLEQIGHAQLVRGLEAKRDKQVDKARESFESAAAALAKAIELSGERIDPGTLESMAEAQLELGNPVEAVSWVDEALERLRLGSNDDYTQFRAAQLTMNAGIVYYRAGQKSTGVAYMDQAISMAPTDFDREDFRDLKEETIGG